MFPQPQGMVASGLSAGLGKAVAKAPANPVQQVNPSIQGADLGTMQSAAQQAVGVNQSAGLAMPLQQPQQPQQPQQMPTMPHRPVSAAIAKTASGDMLAYLAAKARGKSNKDADEEAAGGLEDQKEALAGDLVSRNKEAAMQDNTKESVSCGGEGGFTYRSRAEDHAKGADAWDSCDRYLHKDTKKTPLKIKTEDSYGALKQSTDSGFTKLLAGFDASPDLGFSDMLSQRLGSIVKRAAEDEDADSEWDKRLESLAARRDPDGISQEQFDIDLHQCKEAADKFSPLADKFFGRCLAAGMDAGQVKEAVDTIAERFDVPDLQAGLATFEKVAGLGGAVLNWGKKQLLKAPKMFGYGAKGASKLKGGLDDTASKVTFGNIPQKSMYGRATERLGNYSKRFSEFAKPVTHSNATKNLWHHAGRPLLSSGGGSLVGSGVDQTAGLLGVDTQGYGAALGGLTGLGLASPLVRRYGINRLAKGGVARTALEGTRKFLDPTTLLGSGTAGRGLQSAAGQLGFKNLRNFGAGMAARNAQASPLTLAGGAATTAAYAIPAAQGQYNRVKNDIGNHVQDKVLETADAVTQRMGYKGGLPEAAEHVGGMMRGGLMGQADQLMDQILGMAMSPQQLQSMHPAQKFMILAGGLGAIGGFATGNNTVGALGTAAALGGLAPMFMGQGQGQQRLGGEAPQRQQMTEQQQMQQQLEQQQMQQQMEQQQMEQQQMQQQMQTASYPGGRNELDAQQP